MTQEMQFKKIIAQYCDVKPEEMTNDMKFREDLGFSSLDLCLSWEKSKTHLTLNWRKTMHCMYSQL